MKYRLLQKFRNTFEGVQYRHRNSTLGDLVALELYEDILDSKLSGQLEKKIRNGSHVVNTSNRRRGKKARRGDGTFGELIPQTQSTCADGYSVKRGEIATVEIGIEVKILSKAMVKQIDRVISDLKKQAEEFRSFGDHPIVVGIVGINSAEYSVGYEGGREYKTDGTSGRKHPWQEAAEVESRLIEYAKPAFDEFLIFKFVST